MNYKKLQSDRQINLIEKSDIFNHVHGNGCFRKKDRQFVLKDPNANLYAPIETKAINYFKDNGISWWMEKGPSGHTLSSQIACLNHLISIMEDKEAVLSIINGISNEFTDILPILCDKQPQYISFEVVSNIDHLNEGTSTRGSNCTSVDALILARHKSGNTILIPIEWKYTESYANFDKSTEGEEKSKGLERQRRYNHLIDLSDQLKTLETYESSVYYQEPFYQLMRQTLWAEQIIKHKTSETIQADDFCHIHVIPDNNKTLLDKKDKISGKGMEETWRGYLKDNSKYIIIDPSKLLAPIRTMEKYKSAIEYLESRYW